MSLAASEAEPERDSPFGIATRDPTPTLNFNSNTPQQHLPPPAADPTAVAPPSSDVAVLFGARPTTGLSPATAMATAQDRARQIHASAGSTARGQRLINVQRMRHGDGSFFTPNPALRWTLDDPGAASSSAGTAHHRPAASEASPAASRRGSQSRGREGDASAGSSESSSASSPPIAIPVPLRTTGNWLTRHFVVDDAEAEYLRYYFRTFDSAFYRGMPVVTFIMFMAAIVLWQQEHSTYQVESFAVIAAGAIFAASIVALAASIVIERLFESDMARAAAEADKAMNHFVAKQQDTRRRSAIRQGNATSSPSSQSGTAEGDSPAPPTDGNDECNDWGEFVSEDDCRAYHEATYYCPVEQQYARRIRLLTMCLGPFLGVVSALGDANTCIGGLQRRGPGETLDHADCHESLSPLALGGLVFLFLQVRSPLVCTVVATIIGALFPVFALSFEQHGGDTGYHAAAGAARGLAYILCAFIFAAMSAARDATIRAHFSRMLETSLLSTQMVSAHTELTAVVSALLPGRLAHRVAKIPGAAGGTSAVFDTPILRQLRDTAEQATVAITEAADFDAFERWYPSYKLPVAGLAHLFTLYDIGTQLFGVDRALTFGDAYVVTAGLVEDTKATVLNLARYTLWQLELNEARMLPLRCCVATGKLTGGVVGSQASLRYQLSGEAFRLALKTIKSVTPRQCWACNVTRDAIGLGGNVRPLGLPSAASIEDEEDFQPLTIDDVRVEHNNDPDGADDGGDALHTADRSDQPGANGSRSSVHGGAAGSVTGSFYSREVDALGRSALMSRASQSAEGAATRTMAAPVINPLVSGFAVDTSNMNATVALHDERTRITAQEDEWQALGRLRWGQFADRDMETRFRESTHGDALSFGALLYILVACLMMLSDWGHAADTPWRLSSAGDIARVTVPPVALLLAIAATVMSQVLRQSMTSRRVARVLLLVAAVLFQVHLWVMPPSFVRTQPYFVFAMICPVLVSEVFRSLFWVLVGTATAVLTVPALFQFGFSVPIALLAILFIGFLFIFAYTWAVASRTRFATLYVTELRFRNLDAVTRRLHLLANGLMPSHALKAGIDAANAEAIRRKILTVPGGRADVYDRIADRQEVENRLRALATVLRGDFADVAVDHPDWMAVAYITLVPIAGVAVSTDPLDRVWAIVERCLADTNDATLVPEELNLGVLSGATSEAGVPDSFALDESLKAPQRGGGRQTKQLVGFIPESAHLRLLRAMHDTLVVGGPLDEWAHRESVTISAANCARFVHLLAAEVQPLGFGVACALVVEEGTAALLGRGTMRYGVHGVALRHATALNSAVRTTAEATADGSLIMAITHNFHVQLRIAEELYDAHNFDIGFDTRPIRNAKPASRALCVRHVGVCRPLMVRLKADAIEAAVSIPANEAEDEACDPQRQEQHGAVPDQSNRVPPLSMSHTRSVTHSEDRSTSIVALP